MALNGHGITIPSNGTPARVPSDPHTLNQWLQRNHGYGGLSCPHCTTVHADYHNPVRYVDGDDFDEARLPALDPAHVAWPSDADHRVSDSART